MKPFSVELSLLLVCLVAHSALAMESETASTNDVADRTHVQSPQHIKELEDLRDKLGKSVDTWTAKQILGIHVDEQEKMVVVTHGQLGSRASVEAWLDRKGIGRNSISIQRYTPTVNIWLDPPPPPPYPFIAPR